MNRQHFQRRMRLLEAKYARQDRASGYKRRNQAKVFTEALFLIGVGTGIYVFLALAS